jgi:hypothetical protein
LQNAWNKYGEDNFYFSVLELVPDKDKLIEREQYWIDKLNACDRKDRLQYFTVPLQEVVLGLNILNLTM